MAATALSAAPSADSLTAPFFPEKLAEIDRAILQTISSNRIPGGVYRIERNGVNYQKSYGRRSLVPEEETMTSDTIFDAASLTKVIATAPAILLLIQRQKVVLDAPAAAYLPEFTGQGREAIRIRHLLTHTSGLRPGLSPLPKWSGYDTAIQMACNEKLLNAPGAVFRYSDINFILLGEIVRRVSGKNLHAFTQEEIFAPLGMLDTEFTPPSEKHPRIAPTEKFDEESDVLRGKVHDPTARRMGGIAGHAGLFTTASDLARFAQMILQNGTLNGKELFLPETVRLMTDVQTPESVPARRGLGWDIDSGYSRPRGKHFPLGSFGHTGWTGTSLWIDPFSNTFWLFLSNRVHPDGKGNVLPLQAQLGSLSAEAVIGFNFAGVPGALAPRSTPDPLTSTAQPARPLAILNGIDVLKRDQFKPLRGLRLGLITNQTGADRNRQSTADLLFEAPGVLLKVLFSPEHGIRGILDDKVNDAADPKTGLPIFSLYGNHRSPQPDQLRDLDALVFDIQDIGARFYTYISTMGLCLEAAGQAGLKFFVLDRINPINGAAIEGPVLNGETTFTGFHPIPVRHGMTVGELALLFKKERNLATDLTVIRVEGWRREDWMDRTGLPWINPSPNMRSLTQAALYPGIGLLEMTALSVGRGTDTPFEVIGAPYIDDVLLAEKLNEAGLKGIRFVPIRFTPAASVFKDVRCGGVSILLTDRESCPIVDAGITIAKTLHALYPKEFNLDKMDTLLRHRATLDAIRQGKSLEEIKQIWAIDLKEFAQRRAMVLLYK